MTDRVYLRFRSATDTMPLDRVSMNGYGVEALKGVTGLGLPPVSTQWLTGAGDGATYRGERKQPRDIDVPLHILMPTRADLELEMARLSRMVMNGPFDMDVVEASGNYWTNRVVRVGGGDFSYGEGTTGERELTTVITVRGAPYFTSYQEQSEIVTNKGAGRGLLGAGFSLVSLKVAASQAIGDMLLRNEGDAPAYPVWRITGPGKNLVVSDGARTFQWNGTLTAGEELIIDTRRASVRTAAGASRYADLAPAPRFWRLEPGQTLAHVSLASTNSQSAIRCTWRPKKWWVI